MEVTRECFKEDDSTLLPSSLSIRDLHSSAVELYLGNLSSDIGLAVLPEQRIATPKLQQMDTMSTLLKVTSRLDMCVPVTKLMPHRTGSLMHAGRKAHKTSKAARRGLPHL